MNQITFSAKYISPAHIMKKNSAGKFEPHLVSFVEINTNNKNDIKALKLLNDTWENSYADIVYDTAKRILSGEMDMDFLKIFLLTNQIKNFRTLNFKDIIAEAQVLFIPREKEVSLLFLQADPKQKFDSYNNDYKHIGIGFLQAIRNIFPYKDISANATKDSIDFYKKHNFVEKKNKRDMYDLILKSNQEL